MIRSNEIGSYRRSVDFRPVSGPVASSSRRCRRRVAGNRGREPELIAEVGASVARCPRTPPDAAKTPGLQIGISNRITRLEQPEHSCRLQLWIGPITAEPCRAKARPLRPRRSYFAPAQSQLDQYDLTCDLALGGGAGYCPRVRKVYYDGHLSPYPACAGTSQYRRRRLMNKDPPVRPTRMSPDLRG